MKGVIVMSKHRKESIVCPGCGNKQDIIIWESLNAELSPEAKRKLLDGDFFVFNCECGYSAGIDTALLYHDMTHQVMVYYVNEDSKNQAKETFEETKKFGMLDYKYRIVNSQDELREKALIFDKGLDDRIIELIKVFYFLQIEENNPDLDIEGLLFYTSGEELRLYIMGTKNMSAIINMELYRKIEENYSERLTEDVDYFVNAEWAMKFFNG